MAPSPIVGFQARFPGVRESYLKESEMAGRNDPCPCGSGKKYKRCCLDLSATRDHLASNATPPRPRAPNFSDALTPDQSTELTSLVQELKRGGLEIDDCDETDDEDAGDICVADAVTEFLQERKHTVSFPTFRRDRQALQFMEIFLNVKGWKLLNGFQEVDEVDVSFVDNVSYLIVAGLLEEILEFYKTTPMLRTVSQEKGAVTALRQFFLWMDRNAMLEPDEMAEAKRLFKGC